MKAIGLTCGIGSMLVGARQAGFDIQGNIEWRRYYHRPDSQGRNTFQENFPGAIFPYKEEELTEEERARFFGADIALGHPECGNFSQLSNVNPDKSDDPADIPLFVDLVAKFKPRFFVMDDLPKSFRAFPISEYIDRLPEYDLFPEWISNYFYGNVQKNRNRMFMIGALKSENWAFVPNEFDHEVTIEKVLGDLPEPTVGSTFNHDKHTLTEFSSRSKSMATKGRGQDVTFEELREYVRDNPEGHIFKYITDTGAVKPRPGQARAYWEGHAHVLDGVSIQFHPVRCLPFTVRERARLQGFPDDFIFYGTNYNDQGEFNHEKNNHLVKQTGKAMPIQFCRYVSQQIAAHIKGEPFEANGQRLIKPNPYVNVAKMEYCQSTGYANQESACNACWMKTKCRIRYVKYGLGGPPGGQPDIFAPGDRVPLDFGEEPK